MIFINLEKTYDKVPKEVLLRYMECEGIHVSYIKFIKYMYDWVKILVRIVGDES